ncbi:MAG: sugar nucleotide-binding protein, partial [Gemmatimonadaceae bacterium]|nr:sugar nucleotide-binding protein [Gemmatimonadaceae bacterium]
PRVVGITTAEYGAPAQRPLNSVLSNSRLEATFGVRMSTWQDQLRDCLAGS